MTNFSRNERDPAVAGQFSMTRNKQLFLIAITVAAAAAVFVIFGVENFTKSKFASEQTAINAVAIASLADSLNAPAASTGTQKIARLLNFGDMMLDRNVKKMIDKNGSDYIFEKLSLLNKNYDAIAANLEGPFADYRRQTTKSIAFRFDPALLLMLKKYNFSIFSNANNHSYDMGSAGFEESKENLRQAGFNFYGSQYNINDGSLLIKKVGDFNIAFIGVNDTNSPINIEKVKALVKKAKSPPLLTEEGLGGGVRADFVILNIHWGEEYKELSNARQRYLARELIGAGVDVIIGHHPHVIQEMEIYKNRPIFYSLGNFVFDQYFSTETQQGLGIGLVFGGQSPPLEGGDRGVLAKSLSFYIFPLQGVKSQVRQMEYDKAVKYMNAWIAKSRLGGLEFNNFNLKIEL